MGNSFPKVSRHLSRNRELFEQFPKPSPGLRARLSQRESDVVLTFRWRFGFMKMSESSCFAGV
jgi:hypothetical protein